MRSALGRCTAIPLDTENAKRTVWYIYKRLDGRLENFPKEKEKFNQRIRLRPSGESEITRASLCFGSRFSADRFRPLKAQILIHFFHFSYSTIACVCVCFFFQFRRPAIVCSIPFPNGQPNIAGFVCARVPYKI